LSALIRRKPRGSQRQWRADSRGWHDAWVSHQHRVFHNPPPATPADVREALDRGDLPNALNAMVGTALYDRGDGHELQELHLQLSSTTTVRSVPWPREIWPEFIGGSVKPRVWWRVG
jgi:hypothetical protein